MVHSGKASGGQSFNEGLYRIHSERSAQDANALVLAAFPEFAKRFSCFGYDWLGRQFAIDAGRGDRQNPLVMMLEPGTGQALEIPFTFSEFHDSLVDLKEEALAESFFAKWRMSGGEPPAIDQCVGYIVPLFLGGQDTVENLELTDLDVYWTLVGQLRRQVVGRPDGTQISRIQLS
jgi:hypothetical protein